MLNVVAPYQQLYWLTMENNNKCEHAMCAFDLHVLSITKVQHNLAQLGPLKGMFLDFSKLLEIAMIHVFLF